MTGLKAHRPQKAISAAVSLLGFSLVISGVTGWPAGHSPTDADIATLALSSCLLFLFAIAVGLFWKRSGAFATQGFVRIAARRLAPPIVAAILTLLQTHRAGDALAVFGALLLATVAFGGTRYPLHLSGVARFVFDLFMPAAGVSLTLVAAEAWGVPLSPGAMVIPLLGAWFVTFLGGWLEEAFNAEWPVRIAVIAEPALARTFAREMENAGVRDHRVVGWISESAEFDNLDVDDDHLADPQGLKWLGSADRIRGAVVDHQIDLLVMGPRGAKQDPFQETVESCVDLSVRLVQASYLYEQMYGRVPIGTINEAWFAYIMHPNFSSRSEWTKRLGDLVASVVLLLVLAPLFAVIALAVKLGDGGSIFFRQRRVGAHGHEFNVLKFRTMREDAETEGARWASADDDRITPVGGLLRKSHLDEIPQLVNVVSGTMSLVGPRPERPEFVSALEKKIPYYSRRVLVKPGITGWAQVRAGYAGSEVGTAFKLCHDLYYIKHRTFLFDLLTMVETLRTLVADEQYEEFPVSETFILGRPKMPAKARVVLRRLPSSADVEIPA